MTTDNKTPALRLAHEMADCISRMTHQLSQLAPCHRCGGSGEVPVPTGYLDPCPYCWGRGWDLDNLEDNGDANKD